MKIDKKNGNCAFNEASHTYWDVRDENKKYINTYNINTTDIDSNITQSKIALLSTKLKLFKKFYNFSDIKYYKNVSLPQTIWTNQRVYDNLIINEINTLP